MEGRTLRILALLSVSLGLGCANGPEVSFDERSTRQIRSSKNWITT
jgi:hypothetical protein